MTFLSQILVLCLLIAATITAPTAAADSDDSNIRNQRDGKNSRSRRSKRIRPEGEPEPVKDANGKVVKRRSRLDIKDLKSLQDEEDVDFQLMSDDKSERMHLVRDDKPEDRFESWSGRNEDTGHSLTVVTTITNEGVKVTTGTMYGENGTVYQIRQLADRDVIVEEVPQTSFDNELEGPGTDTEGDADVDLSTIDQVDGLSTRRSLRRLDSSSTIDVMVVYTKGAMCSAAGYSSGGGCSSTANNKATIEGIINLAVSETNKAYTLSGISTKLRLVHMHYDATYNDYTNAWEATLGNLRNNGDGQLDYVHSMRNQYGADFVAMLVDTGLYCGIGFRPSNPTAGDAFSLTKWSCATGYYSFGHELAHNMGCNHDRNNAGSSSSNNYGYQYKLGSSYSSRFRSIMSYDCSNQCPRVGYFSNPSVNYQGRPTGDAGANNVQWINARLNTYANFRQSVVSNTPTLPAQPTPAPSPAPTFYVPTLAPTNEISLTTTLGGGLIGGAGNMFDIYAKNDLTVTNFAMHSYAPTTITVEVWKRKELGTCEGSQSDQDEWEFLGQASFVASQANQASILPAGTFPPVYMKKNSVQAFYVTYTANTNYNRYSSGSQLGNAQSSNGDLEVREGYAKGYRFGDDYYPRVWNGVVFYEPGTIEQTPSPTSSPTKEPTKAPTKEPTKLPTSVPSPYPSHSPSRVPVDDPTVSPSKRPTDKPTNPPTSSPTQQPIMAPTAIPSTSSPSTYLSDGNQVAEQLTTMFAGGNGQAGNIFEIRVSKTIVVRAFDIHTYSAANVHVYAYYKKGTYIGFEHDQDAWTEMANAWIQGAGSPNPTHISAEDVTPVTVKAGETCSFYITLTESKIRYTNGIITVEDGIVNFINSSGNKYPFGQDYPNRVWNGILYYTVGASSVTNYPTSAPKQNNGPSKQVQTTFANRNGSYGNMFDIVAKEKLIIHNIWLHTYHQFGGLVDVEVYALKEAGESYIGKELDSTKWKYIGGAVVEGRGTGYATQLPSGSIMEIVVKKGDRQAFYVTVVGGGIRYSNGASINTAVVHSSNDDIAIYEGAGVGAPRFGGTFFPRVFNGVLEYYTPDVTAPDISADAAVVDGQFDGIGGKMLEGWKCDENGQCQSGKCGKASSEGKSETLSVGSSSILSDSGSSRRTEQNSEPLFCLDANGFHEEDRVAEAGNS